MEEVVAVVRVGVRRLRRSVREHVGCEASGAVVGEGSLRRRQADGRDTVRVVIPVGEAQGAS